MSTSNKNRVFVIGVGMTKFIKPGHDDNPDYPIMAKQAASRALRDANIPYSAIQCAAVGYVYGDSTCGQRAIYEVGMTGIPIYNVNNNCSTGSTALHLGQKMVEGGLHDCVMALGFEKMEKGSLQMKYPDRTQPLDLIFLKTMDIVKESSTAPFAPQIFGNAGIEHMQKYGTKEEHFAKIAYKNHLHSTNNPYSQFRDKYTLEQIQKSNKIYGPLTKLQCCPTSDGAACSILASERFVVEHGLQDQAVEIVAIALTTDQRSTFDDNSLIKLCGSDMSKRAADQVYAKAGVCPRQIGVVEMHDCFSANELITYEALGLCPEGKAAEFIDSGDNTYGGRVVVNPSGGLISKGHPLGATGLAQCSELCWQVIRIYFIKSQEEWLRIDKYLNSLMLYNIILDLEEHVLWFCTRSTTIRRGILDQIKHPTQISWRNLKHKYLSYEYNNNKELILISYIYIYFTLFHHKCHSLFQNYCFLASIINQILLHLKINLFKRVFPITVQEIIRIELKPTQCQKIQGVCNSTDRLILKYLNPPQQILIQKSDSQTKNSSAFNYHSVQKTVFKIQKKALQKLLLGEKLDSRICKINLLRVLQIYIYIYILFQPSQMKEEDIVTLEQAFLSEQKEIPNLDERLRKVLSQIRVGGVNNRHLYMKYFRAPELENSDEADMEQLVLYLKDLLESKIKANKLQYGQHLVDPTAQDLRRKEFNENKDKRTFVLPPIRMPETPPHTNHQTLVTYESIRIRPNIQNERIIQQQKMMVKDLRSRFNGKTLNPLQQQFLGSLNDRDHAEIQFILIENEAENLANCYDDRGNLPLHITVQQGDIKSFKILIRFGADPLLKNSSGKNALAFAKIYGADEMCTILMDEELINKIKQNLP